MPAQERSIQIDGRASGGDQPQRRHREAMARNTSPQGSNPRAEVQISQWDDADGWEQDEAAGHRARRLLSRSNSGFHRVGDKFAGLRWLTGERWVKRLAVVIAVLAVIFAGCFGGLWWRLGAGPDQSRHGDAVACRRDRGQYRPRQYGRGRRHADRARRPDPDRGAHPRHHRPRPRPRHRRHGAESRGEAVRHRASDGAASRREPQPGRRRTRGSHHAGRPGHGVRRRHRQAAGDRRRLEARCRHRADIPPPGAARRRCAAAAPDTDAKRIAGRPRLARQPEPDRSRRTEPQRDRSEERQSRRRRSAARQQMDVREYQPQPAPAAAAAASR